MLQALRFALAALDSNPRLLPFCGRSGLLSRLSPLCVFSETVYSVGVHYLKLAGMLTPCGQSINIRICAIWLCQPLVSSVMPQLSTSPHLKKLREAVAQFSSTIWMVLIPEITRDGVGKTSAARPKRSWRQEPSVSFNLLRRRSLPPPTGPIDNTHPHSWHALLHLRLSDPEIILNSNSSNSPSLSASYCFDGLVGAEAAMLDKTLFLCRSERLSCPRFEMEIPHGQGILCRG